MRLGSWARHGWSGGGSKRVSLWALILVAGSSLEDDGAIYNTTTFRSSAVMADAENTSLEDGGAINNTTTLRSSAVMADAENTSLEDDGAINNTTTLRSSAVIVDAENTSLEDDGDIYNTTTLKSSAGMVSFTSLALHADAENNTVTSYTKLMDAGSPSSDTFVTQLLVVNDTNDTGNASVTFLYTHINSGANEFTTLGSTSATTTTTTSTSNSTSTISTTTSTTTSNSTTTISTTTSTTTSNSTTTVSPTTSTTTSSSITALTTTIPSATSNDSVSNANDTSEFFTTFARWNENMSGFDGTGNVSAEENFTPFDSYDDIKETISAGVSGTTTSTTSTTSNTSTTTTSSTVTSTTDTTTTSTTSNTTTSSTSTSMTSTSETTTSTATSTSVTSATSTSTTSTTTSTGNSTTTTSTTSTTNTTTTSTSSTTSTASTTTSTSMTTTSEIDENMTTTVTELPTHGADGWPLCPRKGCLPCPDNAQGRPDCRCMHGYTVDGFPALGPQKLKWDRTAGWQSSCRPVRCGVPPNVPHAQPNRFTNRLIKRRIKLSYLEVAEYYCDEGYEARAQNLSGPYPIVVMQCQSDGNVTTLLGPHCMPRCGDGLLMTTSHLTLDLSEKLEECDDGNRDPNDGCGPSCRIEADYVCHGGTASSEDKCRLAGLFVDSSVTLAISGKRVPDIEELRRAARTALAAALGCPDRDIDILTVKSSGDDASDTTTTPSIFSPRRLTRANGSRKTEPLGNTSVDHEFAQFPLARQRRLQQAVVDLTTAAPAGVTTTTTALNSSYADDESALHRELVSVQISFRVKISNPEQLSIDEANSLLSTPSVLMAKIWVALMDHTTLRDLYIRVVDVGSPQITGDMELGRKKTAFSLSQLLSNLMLVLGPLSAYLFLIGFVGPVLYWYFRIRLRWFRLKGRFTDISPEFKGSWSKAICACIHPESRFQCFGALCCMPARIADTWDSMGLIPYWEGVRRGLCCCICYMVGCWPCGAMMVSQFRSEMRDFFGFGDGVKGNLEVTDVCCYACCPCCCVVQEAVHVDGALDILPPPLQDWRMEGGEMDPAILDRELKGTPNMF